MSYRKAISRTGKRDSKGVVKALRAEEANKSQVSVRISRYTRESQSPNVRIPNFFFPLPDRAAVGVNASVSGDT